MSGRTTIANLIGSISVFFSGAIVRHVVTGDTQSAAPIAPALQQAHAMQPEQQGVPSS